MRHRWQLQNTPGGVELLHDGMLVSTYTGLNARNAATRALTGIKRAEVNALLERAA
jgi:hypothetical protein